MLNQSFYEQNSIFSTKRKRITFTSFICTLNFVFTILGYPIIVGLMSMFISISFEAENSRLITIPIRIIFLCFTILAFFLGKTRNGKLDLPFILFIIFTFLYLIRAFSDLCFFKPSEFTYKIDLFQNWMYIVPITLFPLISIYKSWEEIDYTRALDIILIFGTLACISSLINVSSSGQALYGSDAVNRIASSQILNTILLGHIGTSLALCAMFRFINSSKFSIWKILCTLFFFIGIFVMIRSGSRGPLVAFMLIFTIYLSILSRNFMLIIGSLVITNTLVFLLREQIINIIEKISPVLAIRFRNTIEYGEGSGREYMFVDYFKESLEHPIFGFQLDLLGYSHNVFIDAFMMFGFIAGWIVPIILFIGVFRAIYLLIKKIPVAWIAILYLQFFIAANLSGCLGGNSGLQACLVLIFLIFAKYNIKKVK